MRGVTVRLSLMSREFDCGVKSSARREELRLPTLDLHVGDNVPLSWPRHLIEVKPNSGRQMFAVQQRLIAAHL